MSRSDNGTRIPPLKISDTNQTTIERNNVRMKSSQTTAALAALLIASSILTGCGKFDTSGMTPEKTDISIFNTLFV